MDFYRLFKVVLNRAQCKKCGDIITSTHRHDFVSCKCDAIFVDGGNAYLRRGGDIGSFIELSKYVYVTTGEELTIEQTNKLYNTLVEKNKETQ